MDTKAIEKAESRLRLARKALSELEQCENYRDFCDLWYSFLAPAKNVYTTLEQGAKASAQSRQWFGVKKSERKNDPLLQYLFQARNQDEHGLAAISEHTGDSTAIGVSKPGYSNAIRLDGVIGKGGTLNVQSLDGLPVKIEKRPNVRLIPVTGLGGVVYLPPATHKGQAVSDPSPTRLAALAIAYLSELVEEAKQFAK